MTKQQFAATKSQFLAHLVGNLRLAQSLESSVRKAGYWAEADKLAALA